MTGRLTPTEIDLIAEVLAPQKLKTIAIRYLGFTQDDLDTIETSHTLKDQQGTKREILSTWADKNDDSSQKENLITLLRKAAKESGLVTMSKVEEKLGISGAQTDTSTGAVGSSDGRPVLTDEKMLKLSKEITSQSLLTDLGIFGLKLGNKDIERVVNIHKDYTVAANQLLNEWLKGYKGNAAEAYATLINALDVAEMTFFKNVLEGHK